MNYRQIKDVEQLHDDESYVITIKRKGHLAATSPTVTAQAPSQSSTTTIQDINTCNKACSEPTSGINILDELPPMYIKSEVPSASNGTTAVAAPLPGIIIDIKVKAGDSVRQGQELAILEAMKMENSIESPCSGTVLSINVSAGATVSEGTILITIN